MAVLNEFATLHRRTLLCAGPVRNRLVGHVRPWGDVMPIDPFTGIEDLFRTECGYVGLSVHKGRVLVSISLNKEAFEAAATKLEAAGFTRRGERHHEHTSFSSVGFEREDCGTEHSSILIHWSHDE